MVQEMYVVVKTWLPYKRTEPVTWVAWETSRRSGVGGAVGKIW